MAALTPFAGIAVIADAPVLRLAANKAAVATSAKRSLHMISPSTFESRPKGAFHALHLGLVKERFI